MTEQLFLSDNAAPAHPAILEALANTTGEHVTSYGDDPCTAAAKERIAQLFNRDCSVYFVYNGTGANVAALRTVTRPYQAVICTEMAHINEDEAGAPEAIGGFKLLPVPRDDGRLQPEDLMPFLSRLGFEHTSQPATVSLTQATEIGTVYTPAQLRALCEASHEAGLIVHVDGARIANAAASWWKTSRTEGRSLTPEEALRAVSSDAGVDVLSFGATKNGLLFGEAVVFFDSTREQEFRFFRKQTTQLHSKMRYVSVQFQRYLKNGLWFENAKNANEMAALLADELRRIPGVTLAGPVEANGVFANLPPEVIDPLRDEFGFYRWGTSETMVRLMVSWDMSRERVFEFVRRCRERVESVQSRRYGA